MQLKGNFGRECITDFTITDLDLLNDKIHITNWVLDLIETVDMELHYIDAEPALLIDTWEAPGLPHTAGTSLTCLITTSSISVHTAIDQQDKKKGIIYLNLFSCKEFDYVDVKKNIEKHWEGAEVNKYLCLDR